MDEITSLGGTILPLNRRRRDALMVFASRSAAKADKAPQAWVRETWDLETYEAKDLLKGNASEAVWEKIIRHRNGGWRVVLPIMGSVIGHSLEDFIEAERRELEHEAQARERRARELADAEAFLRRRPVAAVGAGSRPPNPRVHL
ncbi:hypothetical protein [Phenylobacterium sp. J367]|uniref:hypothetical protein n=1 Tax=Phenylobacterium sp. J367 TaxID=2898435 RepID=UPI002151885E|nr:hypothetical protein [Phenylobacterium sp. J367]MCR5876955.1 hypothetical protein [Phenylobacterium sp. J367]MCR5877023.1 hypothetical protein [Phenylobacterium sp. J367]